MTKREIYDGIVAEVEADLPNVVTEYPTSYDEVVTGGTATIAINPEGVTLKTPTSAFADYAVRDNVMLKACNDVTFALILSCKIGKYFQEKLEANKPIEQADIEALTMVAHVSLMWEQFTQAEGFLSWIMEHAEKNNLSVPALNAMSVSLLARRGSFDFATCRTDMSSIGDKASKELDRE